MCVYIYVYLLYVGVCERESVRIYLCVFYCILGCDCSVGESYFNFFFKRMNEAKPTTIPCVPLPLGCDKTYDL